MDTRTLRLTILGQPAVLVVIGFYPRQDYDIATGKSKIAPGSYVVPPDGRGGIMVDESPEQVLALWDAAAPATVDRWQTAWTRNGYEPPPHFVPDPGFEPVGPWKPYAGDADGDTHWRRPLRCVGEVSP